MAVKITKENFAALIEQGDKPALVDFWAEWCGPCRMMAPVIDKIAEEHPELLVGKINVDEDGELAQRFGISAIPTVIAFKHGTVVNTSVGVKSEAELLALLS